MLNLDVMTGLDLIIKAKQKEREDRIFSMWVAQLPMMGMSGKSVTFAEYLDRMTGQNIDRRSTKEILAEISALEKEFEVKNDGDGDI